MQDAQGCRPGSRSRRPGLRKWAYTFRPTYWGQGLAEEVGPTIITSDFDNLSVKGLFAGHTSNAASRRVLRS